MEDISEYILQMYVLATPFGTHRQSANHYQSGFLQVSFYIDINSYEPTLSGGRQKPRKMAAGFQSRDGYDMTIERIKTQCREKSPLGKMASRWIMRTEWPL